MPEFEPCQSEEACKARILAAHAAERSCAGADDASVSFDRRTLVGGAAYEDISDNVLFAGELNDVSASLSD